MTLHSSRRRFSLPVGSYRFVFFLSLLLSLLIFLSFLLIDRGLFLYYGDFNVQQIPFYSLSHDAVQSGEIFWNWNSDLGVNFIGSYSFYLLGSPFFWLTLLFPSAAVPYLMAPLLMLKFAFTSVTGYAFLRRFCRFSETATFCALLYAFSGFNLYNIFFNHFNEVVMFFPLLLLAMDELVINNRRGVFALTVGVCAFVNYYFFFGEVLFCILYFFLRQNKADGFRVTLQTFLRVLLEAVIGLFLSAALLVPSALAVLSNERVSSFLSGYNLFVYGDSQRYGLIFSSLFFPPDVPARPNFFPDANAKWSSVSLYLPMISTCGVFAFLLGKKKHWLSRILIVCAVICFIPGLNAAFSLFNYSYYARWFFMPLLMMALATCIALEECRPHFKKAFALTGACMALVALIGILPKKVDGEYVFFSLPEDPARFWVYVIFAAIGLIVCILLYALKLSRKQLFRAGCASLSVMIVLCGVMTLSFGRGISDRYNDVANRALFGADKLSLDESKGFFRIDTYGELDNLGMFWRIPTINAFHSVVPSSIMEYYEWIGGERGVGSRPEPSLLGVRAITSVRYAFSDATDYTPMDGFSQIGIQNGYTVYENDYFIPMGFSYDTAVTEEQVEKTSCPNKDRLLVRALLLSEEDYQSVSDILPLLSDDEVLNGDFSSDAYYEDCENRAASAVDTFSYSSKGFTAQTSYETDRVVFFSVPYDEGWHATVNGEEAQILKADVGFMAVRVPAGESEIVFTYQTPGLLAGVLITIVGLFLFAGYLWLVSFLRKRGKMENSHRSIHRCQPQFAPTLPAKEAYTRYCASQKNLPPAP